MNDRILVTYASRAGSTAGVAEYSEVPSFADRLKFRLSSAFGIWKEGDHRDWGAIRAWAADLQPLLEAKCLAALVRLLG
jgi:hypothetical protein